MYIYIYISLFVPLGWVQRPPSYIATAFFKGRSACRYLSNMHYIYIYIRQLVSTRCPYTSACSINLHVFDGATVSRQATGRRDLSIHHPVAHLLTATPQYIYTCISIYRTCRRVGAVRADKLSYISRMCDKYRHADLSLKNAVANWAGVVPSQKGAKGIQREPTGSHKGAKG